MNKPIDKRDLPDAQREELLMLADDVKYAYQRYLAKSVEYQGVEDNFVPDAPVEDINLIVLCAADYVTEDGDKAVNIGATRFAARLDCAPQDLNPWIVQQQGLTLADMTILHAQAEAYEVMEEASESGIVVKGVAEVITKIMPNEPEDTQEAVKAVGEYLQ